MTLRHVAALAAVLGLVLALAPAGAATASGGGGCGEAVTDGSGTKVTIQGYCFSPTVLYAQPGDTVTWTNRDPATHNVAGANMAWGSFEQLRRKRSVSYEFPKAGVFSYVCSLHPGMVGTVVVGDPVPGSAKGADEIVPVSAVEEVPASAVEEVQANSSTGGFLFGGLVLWASGLVMGAWAGRRRAAAAGRTSRG